MESDSLQQQNSGDRYKSDLKQESRVPTTTLKQNVLNGFWNLPGRKSTVSLTIWVSVRQVRSQPCVCVSSVRQPVRQGFAAALVVFQNAKKRQTKLAIS